MTRKGKHDHSTVVQTNAGGKCCRRDVVCVADRGSWRRSGRGNHILRQEGRSGDRVPADMEHHRQGMHQYLWPGRRRLCGGLASAGIHSGHAVVDQLPARELQARLQAGHGSRIQEHGQAVLRGRRGHHRRCGAQPGHRLRRGRGGPEGRGRQRLQRVHRNLPGLCHQSVSGRHHRLRSPQLQAEHLRLHQSEGSSGVPPELHVGLQLRKREGTGHPVRLSRLAVEHRCARIPHGRRQAHPHRQHEGHQGEVRQEDRQERQRHLLDSGSHRQLLRSRGHPAEQLRAERHRDRVRLQVRNEPDLQG